MSGAGSMQCPKTLETTPLTVTWCWFPENDDYKAKQEEICHLYGGFDKCRFIPAFIYQAIIKCSHVPGTVPKVNCWGTAI